MALADQLANINSVLTFMERVRNLASGGTISGTMAQEMQKKAVEYLETLFPPPPPLSP